MYDVDARKYQKVYSYPQDEHWIKDVFRQLTSASGRQIPGKPHKEKLWLSSCKI